VSVVALPVPVFVLPPLSSYKGANHIDPCSSKFIVYAAYSALIMSCRSAGSG